MMTTKGLRDLNIYICKSRQLKTIERVRSLRFTKSLNMEKYYGIFKVGVFENVEYYQKRQNSERRLTRKQSMWGAIRDGG